MSPGDVPFVSRLPDRGATRTPAGSAAGGVGLLAGWVSVPVSSLAGSVVILTVAASLQLTDFLKHAARNPSGA